MLRGKWHLAGAHFDVGTTTYDYDPLHRLTRESNPNPGGDTYRYDENGNRVLMSYFPYTYDVADHQRQPDKPWFGYLHI